MVNRLLLIAGLLGVLNSTLAQPISLVANGGFEEINVCTEYDAPCAPEGWFRVPPTEINVYKKKVPDPNRGNAYELVVFANVRYSIGYRIYLYTKLLHPLEAGQRYTLSLSLNVLDFAPYYLDVVFSEREILKEVLDYKPTFKLTAADEIGRNKKTGWRTMRKSFVATGKERFLTFGNFSPKRAIFPKKVKPINYQGDIAFFIDDVGLVADSPMIKVDTSIVEAQRELLYQQDLRHTYGVGIRSDSVLSPIGNRELQVYKDQKPKIGLKQQLIFTIPDVAFDFDQSTLKAIFAEELTSLLYQIRSLNPQAIQISGHTDNIGSHAYNLNLSEKRAVAVQTFFEAEWPDFQGDYSLEAKGEMVPKANNATEMGRAINRRVEILVTY